MTLIFIGLILIGVLAISMIASGVGVLFGGIASVSNRETSPGRWFSNSIPFFVWGLAFAVVALQWLVVERHDLPGTNPLNDGYNIMMLSHDAPATIFAAQGGANPHISWKNAVEGVVVLQVSGKFIVGGRSDHGFSQDEERRKMIANYFVIDTSTKTMSTYATWQPFAAAASASGIKLDLGTPYTTFREHDPMHIPSIFKMLLLVALVLLILRTIPKTGRDREFRAVASPAQ